MILSTTFLILGLLTCLTSAAEWQDRFNTFTTGIGNDAELECVIEPGSNFTGFYRFDGKEIVAGDRIKINSNDDSRILDIIKATEDDYGVYYCNDTTSSDATTLEIAASMEKNPTSPQILLTGEPGIVKYRIYGNPRPKSIAWTITKGDGSNTLLAAIDKNGKKTDKSSERFDIDKKGNLLIKNVKGEDSGSYEVKVKSLSGGRLTGSVTVKVEYKLELKVKPPAAFTRVVGQDLFIPCEILYADSEIKWTFTNTEGKVTKLTEGINEKGLNLTSVSMDNAGTYACSASNKFGNLSVSSSLEKVIDPAKLTSNFQGVVKRRLTTAYELVCSASGSPSPNVLLSKLKEDKSSFEKVADGKGKVSKTFSNLAIVDRGVYSCSADNGAITLKGVSMAESKNMTLEVFAPTEIDESKTTKSVISAIGLDFKIECSAKGFPYPQVQLLGNGTEITTAVVGRVGDIVTAKIVVQKAQSSDFQHKNIICSAKNPNGTKNVVIPLTQIVKAPCPQNLRSTGTIGLSSVNLQWDSVTGADKYFVYVNNSKKAESKASEISVKKLQRKTIYSIHVVSVNLAGTGDRCDPIIIETADIVRPNAIAKNDFSLDEKTSRSAIISWKAPNNIPDKGVLTYKVKWCAVSNDAATPNSCTPEKEQKERRLQLRDLNEKSMYEIFVTAINQGKIGEQSNPFRFETDAPVIATSKPSTGNQSSGLSSGEIAGIIVAIVLIVLIILDVFCCFFNNCGISHCCFETFCSAKDKKYLPAETNDNDVNETEGYEAQELEVKKSEDIV